MSPLHAITTRNLDEVHPAAHRDWIARTHLAQRRSVAPSPHFRRGGARSNAKPAISVGRTDTSTIGNQGSRASVDVLPVLSATATSLLTAAGVGTTPIRSRIDHHREVPDDHKSLVTGHVQRIGRGSGSILRIEGADRVSIPTSLRIVLVHNRRGHRGILKRAADIPRSAREGIVHHETSIVILSLLGNQALKTENRHFLPLGRTASR